MTSLNGYPIQGILFLDPTDVKAVQWLRYKPHTLQRRANSIATVIYFNKFEMKLSHENSCLIYLPEKFRNNNKKVKGTK